jgi:hypothetical protein
VKSHGPSAACGEGDSLDAHLFPRDGDAAGVARLPVTRSAEDSRDAITRKTAVLELVRDEDVKSFVVHIYGGSPLGCRDPSRKSNLLPGSNNPNGPRCRQATQLIKRQPGPHGLVDRKKGVLVTPLLIPDAEAHDVQLKGLPAASERDPLHHHLVLCDR